MCCLCTGRVFARQVLDVVEAFDPEMSILDDQLEQVGSLLFPLNEW